MKALSIRQPWADAILFGGKRVENRTWPAPADAVGSRILIHAAKAYDPMGRFVITDWQLLDGWPDDRGAVLGFAHLTGCHRGSGGCLPWGEPNTWHWQLSRVHVLETAVPCPGRLGLWTPPSAVLTAVDDTDTIPVSAVGRRRSLDGTRDNGGTCLMK